MLGCFLLPSFLGLDLDLIRPTDGTILTCAHLVVDFQGIKASSKGKINSKTPLPTAKLGDSSKLRPGDWVLAMGCPLSLQNMVTTGNVIAQVSEHPEWLPEGWTVQPKTCKGVRIGRTFKFYVDPSAAVKLYSKSEVLRYLESAKENSSTMKQKELGTGVESLSKASVEKVEPEELPLGWVSKLKAKGKRRDWFHTNPVTGITFRSRKDIFRYLETGEISRHAIKPKNSSKNDSEIISNPHNYVDVFSGAGPSLHQNSRIKRLDNIEEGKTSMACHDIKSIDEVLSTPSLTEFSSPLQVTPLFR